MRKVIGTRQPWTRGVAVSALMVGMTALAPTGAGAQDTRAQAGAHTVSQKNLQFNPFEMTVAVGDTVTWTNNETDASIHSVVQQGGSEINSPDIAPGAAFDWTFTQVGAYTITCRFHPDMFQTLTVAEAKAAKGAKHAEHAGKASGKAKGKAQGKTQGKKAGKKGKKAVAPVNHDAHAESAAKSKPAPPPGPPDSTVPGVGGLPLSPTDSRQR